MMKSWKSATERKITGPSTFSITYINVTSIGIIEGYLFSKGMCFQVSLTPVEYESVDSNL